MIGQPVAACNAATSSTPTPLRPPARIEATPAPRARRGRRRVGERAVPGDGSGTGGGQWARRAEEWLPEGEVELHRPDAARSPRIVGQFAPELSLGVVGDPGVAGPADVSPYRSIWSMVCGAPTPRSSSGRSAVTTIIGHLRQSGFDHRRVEVGRRRAARAQQEGRNPSSPRPSATNPANARRARHGSQFGTIGDREAIGVEREPGAMTACTTPRRIHSSTSVAQNVAWTSCGRRPCHRP